MAGLKLAKLPEHTPVKLTVNVALELHAALVAYAELCAETYGGEEPVAEVVPATLALFLDSDREFARRRRR